MIRPPSPSRPSPSRARAAGPRDPSRILADLRLPLLQSRRPHCDPAGPFAALTWQQQRLAESYLYRFCQRWGSDLPPWRRAILIGVAKRLALHPPPPGWGRSMLAHRGGKATKQKAELAGEPNPGLAVMRARQRERAREKVEGKREMPKRQLPFG